MEDECVKIHLSLKSVVETVGSGAHLSVTLIYNDSGCRVFTLLLFHILSITKNVDVINV